MQHISPVFVWSNNRCRQSIKPFDRDKFFLDWITPSVQVLRQALCFSLCKYCANHFLHAHIFNTFFFFTVHLLHAPQHQYRTDRARFVTFCKVAYIQVYTSAEKQNNWPLVTLVGAASAWCPCRSINNHLCPCCFVRCFFPLFASDSVYHNPRLNPLHCFTNKRTLNTVHSCLLANC